MSQTGATQGSSVQDLLVGGGATIMDLERRLCCLSLNPTLRLAAMSSSHFGSQMIRGTMGSTSLSGSIPTKGESVIKSHPMPAAEENVEVEANNDTGNGASAILIA